MEIIIIIITSVQITSYEEDLLLPVELLEVWTRTYTNQIAFAIIKQQFSENIYVLPKLRSS